MGKTDAILPQDLAVCLWLLGWALLTEREGRGEHDAR